MLLRRVLYLQGAVRRFAVCLNPKASYKLSETQTYPFGRRSRVDQAQFGQVEFGIPEKFGREEGTQGAWLELRLSSCGVFGIGCAGSKHWLRGI